MTDPASEEVASNDLFGPTPRERVQRIWSSCWIDYPVASQALKRLEWLYDHPRVHRPPCCLIVGESNHGKTTIARKFERMHEPTLVDGGTSSKIPVVYAQSPPMADIPGLYSNILRAVGAPTASTASALRKQDQVLNLLTRLGTRVLIIDELHTILDGKKDQKGLFLNVLRHLTNELEISLVGIGTKGVLRVFQTNQEFGNRFTPFTLPRWQVGPEYAKFLANICRHGGLQDVAFIKNKALVRRIHTLSEGLTGETWEVMCTALERIDETGRTAIDGDTLDEIDWTVPAERRGTA